MDKTIKDSLYFSHDYNARNDRKIAALLMKYKSSGYGIFWAATEMMHEEGGYLDLDQITFSAIAKDLNEEISHVKTVLSDCVDEFKLFVHKDGKLVSNRVERNILKKREISELRSKANKSRTNVQQKSTNGQQNSHKRKKEIKEIKAVGFSEDGLEAVFKDGGRQKLGNRQLELLQEGSLKPYLVELGKIE